MKRVGAVTDTLDDILASIETEEKQESSNVAEFLQWCRDNTKSMEKTLTTAQRDLEEASTADKELSATVEGLESTLGELDSELEETQDMVDQSQTRRDEENAKYTEDMQMNSQSLNQINQAISIVGKVHGEGGLLQQDLEQSSGRQEMEASEKQKEDQHNGLMTTKKQQLAMLSEESV